MPPAFPQITSRREMLSRCGLGMGALSLVPLLQQTAVGTESAGSGSFISPLASRESHFPARAKRIIHIFPEGGPSQVDTFDEKPALDQYHGSGVNEVQKDYTKNGVVVAIRQQVGRLSGKIKRSAFPFTKHGESGIPVSNLFPKLARHVDEMCIVRSMRTSSSVHEPAQLMMNTGDVIQARPSLGSWAVYGLGTENENLPAFVALSPNGTTSSGDKHWSNVFLPSWSRGTAMATEDTSVDRLLEHLRSGSTSLSEQRRQLDLLARLNHRHQAVRPGQALLEGRITSFETAFRMQVEATDAFDIAREPLPVREMYGDTQQGRQLLLARRLVERGVRFVQVWHKGWDTHDENDERHRDLCGAADQPLAALLEDLRQRDLLRDTLVIWAGEFGRTPTTDNNDVASKKSIGRDHNAAGFTIWMAGGGVKRGFIYGATDELGAVAVENPVDVHDLHATILHLLGFDHEQLTHRHAGRDFRLTDVHGRVVREILA